MIVRHLLPISPSFSQVDRRELNIQVVPDPTSHGTPYPHVGATITYTPEEKKCPLRNADGIIIGETNCRRELEASKAFVPPSDQNAH